MNFDPSKLSTINISENGQDTATKTRNWRKRLASLESNRKNEIQPYRADPAIMDSLLKNLYPSGEQVYR